jgi:transposase InsO family protein
MYELMEAEKANFPISKMCGWLDVSRAGFYEWRNRPLSETGRKRETLLSLVNHIFDNNRRVYGHRRIHAVLNNSGHQVAVGTVARFMRRAGLIAVQRKAYKRSTVPDPSASAPADLIGRDFTAEAPGEKCVGDITYIKTGQGWLFLSTVVDLFHRKVVGWSMNNNMRTDLICDALTMAKKHGHIKDNAIFHSDRGSQYTSDQFATYCDDTKREGKPNQIRIRRSAGNTGVCYDNAAAESFFGTLKNEYVHHQTFTTRAEAKTGIAEYIEVFYNRQRIHSSLGYMTPQHVENQHRKNTK